MSDTKNELNKTKNLVLTGLLFALGIVLSIVEGAIPPLVGIPGIKLGLSNIIVMYSLFFLGKKEATIIMTLKAFFVFLTRGVISAILSFSGGFLSILVMIILITFYKKRLSYYIISISGAIFHNIGQLIAVTVIYKNLFFLGYFPILLISGLAAGFVTSNLLKIILPAIKRIGIKTHF